MVAIEKAVIVGVWLGFGLHNATLAGACGGIGVRIEGCARGIGPGSVDTDMEVKGM